MTTDIVIGFIDRLGYARCVDCAARADREWSYPVWSDSAPHNNESCDMCGRSLREIAR